MWTKPHKGLFRSDNFMIAQKRTKSILLVNQKDQAIGYGEKLAVHLLGRRHRAFSIFIFNSCGELLIQKRAREKYHSGGLWSNSACGHFSRPLISTRSVRRRLKEETGLSVPLQEVFSFAYRARLANNLIENEIDHVFVGRSDLKPNLNREEAVAYKYIGLEKLKKDLARHPERYSAWLKLIMDKYFRKLA